MFPFSAAGTEAGGFFANGVFLFRRLSTGNSREFS
jgi:hypothetical protein